VGVTTHDALVLPDVEPPVPPDDVGRQDRTPPSDFPCETGPLA
jgi:hypothetical protein